MNILLTNKYGAKVVTCERHESKATEHVYGLNTRTETADECSTCRQEAWTAGHPDRVRAALLSPSLSHTRASRLGGPAICIYHYDKTSPTGVMLACMCDESLYNSIAADLRGVVFAGAVSPLSPTEMR